RALLAPPGTALARLSAVEQPHHVRLRLVQLRERALARRLVGSPAQQARAVAEAAAAEMVVGDLDHEAGLERQPMRRAARGPAARAARLVPGKAGRRNERFEPARERHAVDARESGREPDMVQQSGIVVEAE